MGTRRSAEVPGARHWHRSLEVIVGKSGHSKRPRWGGARQGGRIDFSAYETLTDALQALERGEVEAVVSDEALLRYQISAFEMRRLHVLPFTLDEQDYGFAVIEAGALREPINRALLTVTVSDAWEQWQRDFLGN